MSDYVECLNNFYKDISDRLKELESEQSQCDLEVQDILHYIENEKWNAVVGSKMVKALKETRQRRRNIKNEHEELQSLQGRMINAGLVNFCRPQRGYTYRSNIVKNIIPKTNNY